MSAHRNAGYSTMLSTLGAAAVDLAGAGYAVFPLRQRSKRPLVGHGCLEATPDVARVGEWWVLWPDANVGVATGSPSGLYVIDLDGPAAADEWSRLVAEHGGSSTTLTVSTGRGSHLWFTADDIDDLPSTAGRLAAGIDTRGRGGYVVAPPSVHPDGGIYKYRPGETMSAPLPAWVRKLVTPPPRPARVRVSRPPLLAGEITTLGERRWRAVLDLVMAAPEGQRHNRLYWCACVGGELVADGLVSHAVVEASLYRAAEANGLASEDEPNVRRTINDGIEKGASS